MRSLSHAWFARHGWGLLLVLTLSGCSLQELMPGQSSVDSPEKELQALLAQPWIDPLTDYIKQHQGDAARKSVVARLLTERERRCNQVDQRYVQRDKTADALTKYRAGYGYSCPQQVQAFAEQVEQVASVQSPDVQSSGQRGDKSVVRPSSVDTNGAAAANECYLLTQIHNHLDAISACQAPAQAGDTRAQRSLAQSLFALQRYEEAHNWLLQAARQGDVQAQLRLAEISLNGPDGHADPALAWAWLLQAGEQHQAAGLAQGLSAGQRERALDQVRQQLGIHP